MARRWTSGVYGCHAIRLVIALFVTLLIVIPGQIPAANAFFPTKLRGSLTGSASHESITEDALKEIDNEFFSISKLTRTMKKAISQVADANAAVDDDQVHAAFHFDGESFPEGQLRLIILFNSVSLELNSNNPEAARKDLGSALHTLQDFYAHSNWIELGNSSPNPDLGRSGHSLTRLSEFTATCNGSTLITDKLTSGYYSGEDRTAALLAVNPNGLSIKCRHGGPFDHTPGSGGINKDSASSTFSPHSSFHAQAASVAKEATKQFLRDIKAKVTEKQLKQLLGVGPTLGMAIDTTGSMGDIINSVQDQAIQIVDARLGTAEEPSQYVLSPFNDPSVGPVTVTDNPDVFKAAIRALTASGGGDCPELSQSGMFNALSNMSKGGDLFMFTDASAKDAGLAAAVGSLAANNDITVNPMVFGSCSPIDPSYFRVAADSGGQVFVLQRTEAGAITRLADVLARSNVVKIATIADTLTAADKTYQVPVDASMTRVTFSVTGTRAAVVRRPDGTVIQPTDTGVSLVSTSGGVITSVATPAPGAWTVTIPGPGEVTLNVTGESLLNLESFRFVHSAGRPGFEHLEPIAGFPVAGQPNTAHAVMSEGFASATFEFRTRAGAKLQSVTLDRGSLDAANEFVGDVTPPAGPFVVYVTGSDSHASAFQRVLPAPIQAQAVSITTPAPQSLQPGRPTTYVFGLTNFGPADNFRVSATDDRGFIGSVLPTSAGLTTGQSTDVTIVVTAPSGTTPGTNETLTLVVESSTGTRNFAVLESTVSAGDSTPPVTVASLDPAPNANGWNKSDVNVTLMSTDNEPGGTGVKQITYRATGAQQIDTTMVTTATITFAVKNEGVTTVTYFATDGADNVESPHTLVVKIDKTAPEASARFDPTLKDVLVFGHDALSGLPATAIAPTSVVVSSWNNDDDQADGPSAAKLIQTRSTAASSNVGVRAGDDAHKVELRTYTISDLAGNQTVLVMKVQREQDLVRARLLTVQYGMSSVVTLVQNGLRFHVDEDGDTTKTLQALNQIMSIRQGRGSQVVDARFDARRNQTVITVENRTSDEDDDRARLQRITKPGLDLLEMGTTKGQLSITF